MLDRLNALYAWASENALWIMLVVVFLQILLWWYDTLRANEKRDFTKE